MLGHKRIPSREGGIEIVVEELATRMVTLGHKVTCYNRSGHHVSGKDFDGGKRKAYKGVRLKSVLTLDYQNNIRQVLFHYADKKRESVPILLLRVRIRKI